VADFNPFDLLSVPADPNDDGLVEGQFVIEQESEEKREVPLLT
jgi:hypothetical protein